MNDNKSPEQAENKFYYEFQIKSRGVCVTEIASADELRAMIQEDLTAMYGAEGFSIVEIREATDEEFNEATRTRELIDQMFDDAGEPVPSENITVN